MNIAFLTAEYSHPKVKNEAGIGTSIKNLAQALNKSGNEITIFVYGQNTQEIINEDGIKIHLIKNKKYNFLGWYFHRKHIQKYCRSIIREEKIEIIEAPDWTGITAFMKFQIPLIIRLHGSDTYFCHLEKRKQKWKNFWFEKSAVKKAKAFIAPTSFAGKLSNSLFKIKNIETKVIPNGLDLNSFRNDSPREYTKKTILYIGTLIRKKGVLELPEIFEKVIRNIPDATLVMIGNDSSDAQTNSQSTWQLLQKQFEIRHLSENVIYLGKIPYHEVQNNIKEANVCIFPSFAETLGMVTIESMAMQKAVVNSNIGWAQELIIDGECGFLVDPKNHQLYADKIVELIENELLCIQIGKNAREAAEIKFDIIKLAEENKRFYCKIVNQYKTAK